MQVQQLQLLLPKTNLRKPSMKFSEMIMCISSIEDVSEGIKQEILSYIQAQEDLLESKEIDKEKLVKLINSITTTEKSIEEIRILIDKWINENFDQDRQAQQLHRNTLSLAELLQAQDLGWERAWGCDSDFRHIIPLLFEKTKENTTYIACHSKTLITLNGIESNGESLKYFIEINLKKSLEKFVLLIPLNDNQRHWLLGGIRVENGKLKKGTLWNSTSEIDEAAFIQFEAILKSIDDCVEVRKLNKKNQIDGFRCFDYVCQEILNYVGTAGDQGITSAETGYELREAIGKKIANSLGCELRHGSNTVNTFPDSEVLLQNSRRSKLAL